MNLDFISLAEVSLDFVSFSRDFVSLALSSPLDDETLKTLFWIGATYHQHFDLPDTSDLDWKEAVSRCLESVDPRSGTQPASPAKTIPLGDLHILDQPILHIPPEPLSPAKMAELSQLVLPALSLHCWSRPAQSLHCWSL